MDIKRFLRFGKRRRVARSGPRIDDLSTVRSRSTGYLPATMDAMLYSLEKYGLVVFRDVIDKAMIGELVQVGVSRVNRAQTVIRDTDPVHMTREQAQGLLKIHAVDLDPPPPLPQSPHNRDKGRTIQLAETTIWSAISKTPIRPLLCNVIGHEASYVNARIRSVLPIPDHESGFQFGRIDMHIERTAYDKEGIHNIWLPLVEEGVVTNRDCPGLQMFVAPRRGPPCRTFSADSPEQYCYRPELSLGDAVVFDGFMPHGSYIPESAKYPRTAFDIRIFPGRSAESTVNGHPGKAIFPIDLGGDD